MKNISLEPTDEILSTVDGTELPLLRETKIPFTVTGVPTECRVVVTDAITELILGIEWLQANNCVWDFCSNSFSIEGKLGRLHYRRAGNVVRRILVQGDIEIPGLHTLEVPVLVARTSLNHQYGSWGMESGIRGDELIVANGIYNGLDLRSLCQVINMSDAPVRLKRGCEIGKAEPVEIIEEDDSPRYAEPEIARFPESHGCLLDLRVLDNQRSGTRSPGSAASQGFPGSPGSEESETGSLYSEEPESQNIIQGMIDGIAMDLTDAQKRQVEELLLENQTVFSTSEFDLGRTDLVRHTIDTGTHRPFKQQLRRHPMAYLPIIDEHVDQMLANDICEPSTSP